MPFRINAKTFILTYPQCDVEKEVALDNILQRWEQRGLEYCIVAHELHKDGTDHLHVVLRFDSRKNVRKEDFFDFITGKHGNYQSARSPIQAAKYIVKDNDYCSWGIDVEALIAGKPKKSQAVAELLETGRSLMDVYAYDKGYFLNNKKKIEDLQSFLHRNMPVSKVEWLGIDISVVDFNDIPLCQWLNDNLFKERDFKQRQLYLYGPPNVGKTSLINQLHSFCRVYYIPKGEDYYDSFENEAYDLAVIDEFKGQKPITWLNEWLQGSIMPLRKKGSQYLKKHNLPTIILSNYSLDSVYAKSDSSHINTLKCRLLEIFVEDFIDLDLVNIQNTQELDVESLEPITPPHNQEGLLDLFCEELSPINNNNVIENN